MRTAVASSDVSYVRERYFFTTRRLGREAFRNQMKPGVLQKRKYSECPGLIVHETEAVMMELLSIFSGSLLACLRVGCAAVEMSCRIRLGLPGACQLLNCSQGLAPTGKSVLSCNSGFVHGADRLISRRRIGYLVDD